MGLDVNSSPPTQSDNFARAIQAARSLPDSEYIKIDLTGELYREVIFPASNAGYRIPDPALLIIRRGGSTHRVIDRRGKVHCYAAPEGGHTVLSWEARPDGPAIVA